MILSLIARRLAALVIDELDARAARPRRAVPWMCARSRIKVVDDLVNLGVAAR